MTLDLLNEFLCFFMRDDATRLDVSRKVEPEILVDDLQTMSEHKQMLEHGDKPAHRGLKDQIRTSGFGVIPFDPKCASTDINERAQS